MSRKGANMAGDRVSVPRASGDEPRANPYRSGGESVFPARAGMSRAVYVEDFPVGGVPRASGDEPDASTGGRKRYVCSPRERG